MCYGLYSNNVVHYLECLLLTDKANDKWQSRMLKVISDIGLNKSPAPTSVASSFILEC